VVTSESGGVFRTTAERRADGPGSKALFLGPAEDLATLSRVVEPSTRASAAVNRIELGSASEVASPDCRRLADAHFVVAALRAGDTTGSLLVCAARGAALIIVGKPAAASETERKMYDRLAVGRMLPWGAGSVAWLPDMRAGVADVLERLDTEVHNRLPTLAPRANAAFIDDEEPSQPKGVPGSGLVLVLLALYVAVIGPVGYFVGVRPRRAWLAWSWFPMVALGATVTLVASSALLHRKPTELAWERMSLVSPRGAGLETSSLRLQGNGSGRFSLSVPLRDGEVSGIERGYRFGTPFAPPAGSLVLTDDRVTGRFAIEGLSVGRYGAAGIALVAPVERAVPEVIRRGDGLVVVNRTTRALPRAVVKTADLCGTVGAVPAGGEGVVTSRTCDSERWSAAETAAAYRWHNMMLGRLVGETLPVGSYVLVVDGDDLPPKVDLQPAIAIRAREVVAVRGPLLGEGSAR
jgi:hypothetical protein